MKTSKYKNLTRTIANLGIIYRAIKSAGNIVRISGVAKGGAVRPWRHFYGSGTMGYAVS